jgi:hypothetical protein
VLGRREGPPPGDHEQPAGAVHGRAHNQSVHQRAHEREITSAVPPDVDHEPAHGMGIHEGEQAIQELGE